jgi:hypothetical protein
MEANVQISKETVKSLEIILAEYGIEVTVVDPDNRQMLSQLTEAQGIALMHELAEQRRNPEFAEYYDEIQFWRQGATEQFQFMSMFCEADLGTARFIWDGRRWDRLYV